MSDALEKGAWLSLIVTAIILARPFVVRWIERRIDASVDEGLKRRLAEHQHELDLKLEDARHVLNRDRIAY